ncbi:hypothetical protein [Pseudomonas tolaasii]|uniref:hypothetical protein n=1 Tax=Pseudomonas tolaasii TaxID=29442 RepID=UPI001C528644|nr:hypothetical protein [Pseudomonas tolaasii]QXQ16357.1 hypothetical protein I7845_15705 [Pseudomonas tolaasii]
MLTGLNPYLWEPGLPAIAVVQSMKVSADPAPSQASQLPHWNVGAEMLAGLNPYLWEPGLAAMAVVQSMKVSADPTPSQASGSRMFIRGAPPHCPGFP